MNKLLRANFSRLFKMKSFWLAMIIVIYYPIMSVLDSYSEMKSTGYVCWFESSFWVMGALIAMMMAVLVHIFIGTEYSDKTIRNKMIVGHSKQNVYISNMLTMWATAGILSLTWIATYCAIGLFLLPMGNSFLKDFIITVEAFVAILLMTALLVLLAMFVSSKISAGVLSMLTCLILLAIGVWMKTALAQKQYIKAYKYVDNTVSTVEIDGEDITEVSWDEDIANPNYIPEGPQKEALRYAMNMSVGAQLLDVNDNHEIGFLWFIVFDNLMLLVITFAGAHIYKRNDIS